MPIADRLKKARSKLGLTQESAATQWGVNIRTLQDWERGHHEPRGFARTQFEKLLAEILPEKRAGNTPSRRGRRAGNPRPR